MKLRDHRRVVAIRLAAAEPASQRGARFAPVDSL